MSIDELFASAGAPARLAAEAAARLGPTAADLLRADPWRLLDVPSVRPDQADHFARGVLGGDVPAADPRRGAGIAAHLLLAAATSGHTALPGPEVVYALTDHNVSEPVTAVRRALDEGRLAAVYDESPHADPGSAGQEWLALPRFAEAEDELATELSRLQAVSEPLPPHETMQSGSAGRHAFAGAPGVELLVDVAAHNGVSVIIASPAAGEQVVARLSGPRVVIADGPVGDAFDADVVVVPEANTVGVERAAAIAAACDDGTHLVFVGDPAGLPPVAPGQPFIDLVDSKAVPVAEEAAPADDLGRLAAAVRAGSLIRVDSPGREVVVVPAGSDAEAAHRVVQLVTDSIPRALGIALSDVQVVTGGAAGAAALNRALKEALNPGPGPFDPGDRVVVGGSFGTVESVSDGGAAVSFAAGTRRVPAGSLRHGWAVPVRHAAAARWPAVVAVFGAADTLSRPLVYTAVTRARRHLSVVHSAGGELARAVREVTVPPRRTRLAGLVAEAVAEISDHDA